MNFMKLAVLMLLGFSASVHAIEDNTSAQENKPEKAYVESEEQIAEKAHFIEQMRIVETMSTCMNFAYTYELYKMAALLQAGSVNNTEQGFFSKVLEQADDKMRSCIMQKEMEARSLRHTK